MRLIEAIFIGPTPTSPKLLYSPGLRYIILPSKLGRSYISQWPCVTLQDWQPDMRKRSWIDSQSSISSYFCPTKFSFSNILILNVPLCCKAKKIHISMCHTVFKPSFTIKGKKFSVWLPLGSFCMI